jgi:isochorismate synthase
MLVRLEGGVVRADCVAGSAPRGGNEIEDDALGARLLNDDKERREHAMVVRGLTGALEDFCSTIEAPAEPSLRKMANVQHLYTPVSAQTEGNRHILELVERLHPTPAVGGLPARRALCLIDRHERFSRGWYAGPIGWMDARGNGEFAVALRSALLNDRRAFLYAGCGIVAGSDPAREYEESQLKLQAMLWALNGSS